MKKAKRMKESEKNNTIIVIIFIILIIATAIVLAMNIEKILPNTTIGENQNKNNNVISQKNEEQPIQKNEQQNAKQNIEIVQIQKDENNPTTQQQAVDATVEQFKRLGDVVEQQELKVEVITKQGEEYYLIKSKDNSILINIQTGKIVRINSVSL